MSRVDELKDRIIDMIDMGLTEFGWTVEPGWHNLTLEEKAAAILSAWDARPSAEEKARKRWSRSCGGGLK